MIDAHLHLDQYPAEEIERLIEHWQHEGIRAAVAVSYGLESSYRTLELKQQFPGFIHAAVGFHPEQPLPDEPDINELLALIECEREQISAIGEVGLPHYTLNKWAGHSIERYQELLNKFIKSAKQNKLPLALHAVYEQAGPVLEMLRNHEFDKAHFHWLKGDPMTVQDIVDSGYYVSLTPEVCYRSRDQKLAEMIPLEQLMAETDGPWRFNGPFEGKTTTPLLLRDVIGEIAKLKNEPESEIIDHCNKNVEKLYGNLS